MRWTDEMRIETPEQIGVDLELAGLGSRFVAQLVDWVWKVFLSLLLLVIAIIIIAAAGAANPFENPSKMLTAGVVSLLYLLWLGYGIYFELRWNGQTPGKRATEIRVVRQNGAPVDGRAVCVRNLLAAADFLPAFQLLGAVLILLTPNRQRLGDLAAGTVVVRERAAGAGPETGEDLTEFASDEFSFTPPQLAALGPTDRAVIRSFLQRFRQMDRRGRERLAVRMADKYVEKTGYRLDESFMDGDTARTFLASLLRDLEVFLRHR